MKFIVVTIPFNRINVTPFELNEGIGSDVPNGSVKIIAKLQSKGIIKRTVDIIYLSVITKTLEFLLVL